MPVGGTDDPARISFHSNTTPLFESKDSKKLAGGLSSHTGTNETVSKETKGGLSSLVFGVRCLFNSSKNLLNNIFGSNKNYDNFLAKFNMKVEKPQNNAAQPNSGGLTLAKTNLVGNGYIGIAAKSDSQKFPATQTESPKQQEPLLGTQANRDLNHVRDQGAGQKRATEERKRAQAKSDLGFSRNTIDPKARTNYEPPKSRSASI